MIVQLQSDNALLWRRLRKYQSDAGLVVPGVAVTISSPVLVAGTMTAVTDAGGVNRFPSLVPGTYTIKVELSGFRTVTREEIARSGGGIASSARANSAALCGRSFGSFARQRSTIQRTAGGAAAASR